MISNAESIRRANHAEQTKPISFRRLISETYDRMDRCDATPSYHPQFDLRKSLNNKFELTANEWTLSQGAQPSANLRMVHIQGARNEIINTWIFPKAPNQNPVFAAELIVVGDVVKVAFIDIQTPALDRNRREDVKLLSGVLSPVFASLPCDEAAPDWAIGDSQGNYTYARNVPASLFQRVEQCYLSYLDTYLDAFFSIDAVQNNANCQICSEATNALHNYQAHHMDHSPGKKFLSVLFGSEWTETFMHNFLFSIPRG